LPAWRLGTLDGSALPAVALQSNRYWNAWSHIPSGYSVPIRVKDTTMGGLARHVWEDPVNGQAQRWSSLFYGANKLLVGTAETTMPSEPRAELESDVNVRREPVDGNEWDHHPVEPPGPRRVPVLRSAHADGRLHAGIRVHRVDPAGAELLRQRVLVMPTGWFYTPTT
jgi:hypothetical protein